MSVRDKLYVYIVELFPAAEVVEYLVDVDLRLFLDIQASEQHFDALLAGAEGVEADLVSRRRAAASATADAHTVGADLLDVHGVEVSDDIGVVVGGGGDFVEDLGRDRADGNQAPRFPDAW